MPSKRTVYKNNITQIEYVICELFSDKVYLAPKRKCCSLVVVSHKLFKETFSRL